MPRPRKLTDDQIAEVFQLRLAHMPWKVIAWKLQCNRSSIWKRIRKLRALCEMQHENGLQEKGRGAVTGQ